MQRCRYSRSAEMTPMNIDMLIRSKRYYRRSIHPPGWQTLELFVSTATRRRRPTVITVEICNESPKLCLRCLEIRPYARRTQPLYSHEAASVRIEILRAITCYPSFLGEELIFTYGRGNYAQTHIYQQRLLLAWIWSICPNFSSNLLTYLLLIAALHHSTILLASEYQ